MQVLVLDDGQEHDEEDDQGRKLRRKVHLSKGSRHQIQYQQIAEASVDLSPQGDGVDPWDEVAEGGEHSPEQRRRGLVGGGVVIRAVHCIRVARSGGDDQLLPPARLGALWGSVEASAADCRAGNRQGKCVDRLPWSTVDA